MEVTRVLTELARRHQNRKFLFQDQEVAIEQLFKPEGCLSIFARRANMLCDFLFGEKLQLSFKSDPGSLTGEKVEILPTQKLFVLVMILYDVLEEMVVNAGGGDVVLS